MEAADKAARIVRTIVETLKPGFAVRLWTGERIGPASGPVLVVNDQDIVWLTDFGANAIVRFDPGSETFTSLPFDRPNAAVRQLLGRPGEIWGAMSGQDRLVVIRTR